MDTLAQELAQQVRLHMRTELLQLSRAEENAAADVAATVRYWEAPPPAVSGHRQCAAVLRRLADTIDTKLSVPRRGTEPRPSHA